MAKTNIDPPLALPRKIPPHQTLAHHSVEPNLHNDLKSKVLLVVSIIFILTILIQHHFEPFSFLAEPSHRSKHLLQKSTSLNESGIRKNSSISITAISANQAMDTSATTTTAALPAKDAARDKSTTSSSRSGSLADTETAKPESILPPTVALESSIVSTSILSIKSKSGINHNVLNGIHMYLEVNLNELHLISEQSFHPVNVSSTTTTTAAITSTASRKEGFDGSYNTVIEIVYQPTYQTGMSRRIVFLAHGCGHAATDFWPEGKMCETCIGLPEETRMVKMLLDAGYSVLAVSSSNQVSKCWNRIDDRKRIAIAIKWLDAELWKSVEHTTVAESQDSQVIRTKSVVVRVDAGAGARPQQQQQQQQQQKLRQLQQNNLYEKSHARRVNSLSHLESRPVKSSIFAIGASSGGSFVLGLCFFPRMQAIVSQISTFFIPSLTLSSSDHSSRMPAIRMVLMDRDRQLLERNKAHVTHAIKMNPSLDVQIWVVPPIPITPSFFSERIDEVSVSLSRKLHKTMVSEGLIDPESGFLLKDPRSNAQEWRQALKGNRLIAEALAAMKDDLVHDRSRISEELNVAWGMHELTADKMAETIAFFDSSKQVA